MRAPIAPTAGQVRTVHVTCAPVDTSHPSAAKPQHIVCSHGGVKLPVPAARLADNPDFGRCHQPWLSGQPVTLTDAEAVPAGTSLPVPVASGRPGAARAGRSRAGRLPRPARRRHGV